jgi:hypothetical protein
MKQLMIPIFILSLALGACASPAASPTPTATLPPPTHTSTPLPTATAVPTNTPTLAPTATSKPTATLVPTSTPEPGIDEDAFQQLLDITYNYFSQGDIEQAQLILTEMLSYPVSQDQKIHLTWYRGFMQGCQGDYEAAITDLLKVLELDPPDADIQANTPYWLCRDYGLAGQPELALPYCEQAVQAEPTIRNVVRRGMIYAQLGRYEDAIIDFQGVIDALGTPEDEASRQELALRQAWLKQLEGGKNPFTPSVLQAEEATTCPVSSSAAKAPKPATRLSLQKIFEDTGLYSFNEITDTAGQEGVATDSFITMGGGVTSVILLGPKNGFKGMLVQIQGGTPDYRMYITLPLLEAIFTDRAERAQAITWLLAGAKLNDGTRTSTEGGFAFTLSGSETLLSDMESADSWDHQKNIGDFTLSAETDSEQNDVFRIVIMPAK